MIGLAASRRRGAALAVGVVLAAPGSALAWPALSGGSGLLDVRSADVTARDSFDVQFGAMSYGLSGGTVPGDSEDRTVLDGGLQITWGVTNWAEVWAQGNMAFVALGNSEVSNRDGRAGLKVVYPGRVWGVLPGLVLDLNVPVGDRARGFSTDALDPGVTVLLTVPLPDSNRRSAAALHFNFGYRSHGDDRGRTFEGLPLYYLEPVYPEGQNDRIDLRAAVEIRSRETTLFMELLLDQLLHDDVAFRESPIFVSFGFRRNFLGNLSGLAGVKVALAADDPATTRFRSADDLYPDWQVGMALSWSRRGPTSDRDGDGVPDVLDQCPHQMEDLDGWLDADGCPDLDNDGDGIPDDVDGAPNQPEDFDGFMDADGIPDPDNDGDGVPDEDDDCPLSPEDFDGVEDEDGCPETDADGDGIPDEDDQCPTEPENFNGVDDEDGCPDDPSDAGA